MELTDTPQQVDLFAQALREALKAPDATLGPALSALLAREELAHLRLSDGRLLRGALLAAQQDLGFPWALEIAPEDLSLLRPPPRHVGLRSAIVVTALGSAGWALWLMVQLNGSLATRMALGAALLFSVAHAAAAAVEAAASQSAKRLLRVARAWMVVPVMLAAALVNDPPSRDRLFLIVGFVSAPSLLPALLALRLARRRAAH